MTGPTIWDIDEARVRRDEALAQVATPAIAVVWSVAAYDALVAVARRQATLSSDDVWQELERMGVSAPPEPRAIGPVMVKGVRAGVIAPIGYSRGTNPRHHADVARVYESRVRAA